MAVVLGACAPTVTRRSTVDPAHALALGLRAEVVAVNGRPLSGSVSQDATGYFLVGPLVNREPLSDTDKLAIDVTYEDGEVIPHEGVVATQPKAALLTTGTVVLLIGALLGTIGGVGASSPPPSCQQLFCFQPDFRGVYVGIGIIGGVVAGTGIGFLIAGALTPVRIGPVSLAPMVSPTATGGAATIAF